MSAGAAGIQAGLWLAGLRPRQLLHMAGKLVPLYAGLRTGRRASSQNGGGRGGAEEETTRLLAASLGGDACILSYPLRVTEPEPESVWSCQSTWTPQVRPTGLHGRQLRQFLTGRPLTPSQLEREWGWRTGMGRGDEGKRRRKGRKGKERSRQVGRSARGMPRHSNLGPTWTSKY